MAQPSRPTIERQCTAHSKRTGERCKRWATPGRTVCYFHGARGGAPKGNKNRLTTGEYEAIWVDTLQEDERRLYHEIDCDKLRQLDDEIKLLTIRERRMMERIDRLRQVDFTLVEITESIGIEKGEDTSLATEKRQATLGQIQRIEEALTRVQAQKARLIHIKHLVEIGAGDEDGSLEGLTRAIRESRQQTSEAGLAAGQVNRSAF